MPIFTQGNPDHWKEFIAQMHSGETLEVDSDIFYYFLGVLPPIFMRKVIDGQRYSFGFAEGAESIVGFWEEKGRFFCRDLGIMNEG